MKTGVIVARFQTSYLHEGHIKLIDYVKERNDEIIIFLGTTESRLTKSNPLNFMTRKKMVAELYPDAIILPIADCKSNEVWTDNLDKAIESIINNGEVTLYGSRGSFISKYSGKHKTELMEEIPQVSATIIRQSHHHTIDCDSKFRQGIIWASGYKYPTSYQTIDVAIVNEDTKQILLGQKEGESKFRFVGGFVDVKDDSLEHAAKREAKEECGDIETDNYKYIGSYRINDFRYRDAEDKIMTAFFYCQYIWGRVNPQDDIKDLKWFDIATISEDDVEHEHHHLLNAFKKYMQ